MPDVSGRHTIYVLAMHAGIAVCMIVAATVLCALGQLDGATVAALFGTAVGLAGGSAGVSGTLGATVNGKSVVSGDAMAAQADTLKAAISAVTANAEQVAKVTASLAPQQAAHERR